MGYRKCCCNEIGKWQYYFECRCWKSDIQRRCNDNRCITFKSHATAHPILFQPPALTLLPCIKAFDAATNPGLIDITELANEVATHEHVTETLNDGTNWYRKWSDGWVEQGGTTSGNNTPQINLLVPMQDANYFVTRSIISGYDSNVTSAKTWTAVTTVTATQIGWFSDAANQRSNRWYVSGWAASA